VLAVLPLSFDAGLSQLTTVFHVGACAVIMDYLLPADVWRAVERHQITGLAGVPPLWNQLVGLNVDTLNLSSLRYITSTGGAMPLSTTKGLSDKLPGVDIFLMYGLTEAFRSTYLPPDQVAVRPLSIGKAIPNAEILVVNKTGQECAPGEPGELVHRGALVAMGYWNAPVKTAERFKPCPGQDPSLPLTEMAVWSGDRVVKDEEGYLFFVSRQDEMIKTSGYRVSPTEVEEVVYASGLVQEAVAIGLSHPALGQAILVCAVAGTDVAPNELGDNVLRYCRKELPGFMVPQALEVTASLPRNPNGKIDRKSLSDQYQQYFEESSGEA
jgi:acyl-coenzyme A synthetase/AMP-(fatty) acid ligase